MNIPLPQYKIGDTVVISDSATIKKLAQILSGYINLKETIPEWYYWIQSDAGPGYYKESNIIYKV